MPADPTVAAGSSQALRVWGRGVVSAPDPVSVNEMEHPLRVALTRLGQGEQPECSDLRDRLVAYREAVLRPFLVVPRGLDRLDALLTLFTSPIEPTEAGWCSANSFQRCLRDRSLGGDPPTLAGFLRQLERRGIAWLSTPADPGDWLSGSLGDPNIVLVAHPTIVIAHAIFAGKPDPLNRVAVSSFTMNAERLGWKVGLMHGEI